MSKKPLCEGCKAFEPFQENDPEYPDFGYCRLNPPVFIGFEETAGPLFSQPTVIGDVDGCFSYIKKDKETI